MPTNGQEVKIAHYTRSKFNSLTSKDNATIYFVEETDGKIKQYIGNTHVVSDITKAQVEAVLAGTITTHTHNASALVQNASNRLVTDTEKTTWNNKVDKVTGKGLSTNDFTTTEKNKLGGIASGAEVNVQSNWNATSGDAFILNKPTIPTNNNQLTNGAGYITGYTETDPIFTAWNKSTGISITKSQVSDLIEATQSISGLMSKTDKARLDVLHSLLEENTANNVVDSINEVLAIFNNYPEGADLVTALAGKVDKVSGKGLSTNDYTTTEKNKLSGIATGAQKNNTITKAEIEAKLTGNITSHTHNYRPAGNVPWAEVSGKPSFATVATSGSYNDLSNKPSIPAAQVQSNWNATTGMGVILNKPSFATVATSGSYNDLSNKPSIPSEYELTKAKIDTALVGSRANSIQLGNSATAKAIRSTALGYNASAETVDSTALGGNTSASGASSIALGQNASASGVDSIAIGAGTVVTEDNVVDFGSTRQVRVKETPVSDRDAASKKYVDDALANITSPSSGTWKEVYSGTSGRLSEVNYLDLTLNETSVYYNRPMMMEIKYGGTGDTYTDQIVTFNVGTNNNTTNSKSYPRTVSITDFDGRYFKTISTKAYVTTTEATNILRVGYIKTLIGDFTGTSGTLTWTTESSDNVAVYVGRVWVME